MIPRIGKSATMRRLLSILTALIFISGFTIFGSPSQAATPQPTITTCTNPQTKAQLVLHADQPTCPTSTFTAHWHLAQSDSAGRSDSNYASITVCTTKGPELNYQLIRTRCPKYENTNTYFRNVASPVTSEIISATPLGYDGALLKLSPQPVTDSPIAYYLVKNLTTGGISSIRTNGSTSLYIYKLKAKTNYTFQILAVSIDGLSRFVATSKTIGTAAMPVVPSAVVVSTSCAAGGSCSIGDVGPGGGTVFYVNVDGFNCGATNTATGSPTGGLCHYLEVPDNTWFGGSVDPMLPWAAAGFTSTNVSGLTNIGPVSSFDTNAVRVLQNPANLGAALGAGYANTLAIIAQNGSCALNSCTYAAGAAHAYTNNSLTDWYLPDPTELNQLMAWARGETRALTLRAGPASVYVQGGFANGNYLSSNSITNSTVWYQYSQPGGGLNEGVINGANKSDGTLNLRPIRAF